MIQHFCFRSNLRHASSSDIGIYFRNIFGTGCEFEEIMDQNKEYPSLVAKYKKKVKKPLQTGS